MLNTHKSCIGWDIGGAHLKAAYINEAGIALKVIQLPCQLWRGLDMLNLAITQVFELLALNPSTPSAVTMTGELVDLFENRHQGVLAIAQVVQQKMGVNTLFYAGHLGFVSFTQVATHTQAIASMNWYASAQYIAQHVQGALFIDIGSTTTDLISIKAHGVSYEGLTDAVRMCNNELLYTGVIRTPLMALAPQIDFMQKRYHVAAEHFATTADAYRLLGQLPVADDLADTADGKGKSPLETARRIARMIGHDVEDAEMQDWVQLAHTFKLMQLEKLKQAIQARLVQNTHMVFIGAGIGSFLVQDLAQQMHCAYSTVAQYIKAVDADVFNQAAICFPAYAVAKLALYD